MKKEYEEVLDYLNWDCYTDYDRKTLEPLYVFETEVYGNYFCFCVETDNFIKAIKEFADSFDPEKYAEDNPDNYYYDDDEPEVLHSAREFADFMKELLYELGDYLEKAESEDIAI